MRKTTLTKNSRQLMIQLWGFHLAPHHNHTPRSAPPKETGRHLISPPCVPRKTSAPWSARSPPCASRWRSSGAQPPRRAAPGRAGRAWPSAPSSSMTTTSCRPSSRRPVAHARALALAHRAPASSDSPTNTAQGAVSGHLDVRGRAAWPMGAGAVADAPTLPGQLLVGPQMPANPGPTTPPSPARRAPAPPAAAASQAPGATRCRARALAC